MNRFHYSIFALLLGSTGQALAAENALNPIVVTATRTAQYADETLAPVTVITQEEIQRSQAGNLTELLAGSAGIDVTETGWYGQYSNYYIRGASSKHILVLVDGVPLGSATTGSTDLAEIGLEHIARIEIVRGPRSSLYGSSAVGGVIHIITQQGEGSDQASINLGYGSYNTRTLAAKVGGGSETTRIQMAFSRLTTDGTDVSEDNNPDDDAHQVSRVSGNLTHRISARTSLNLAAYQSQGVTEYDSRSATSDYYKETTQQTVSGGLTLAPTEAWQLQLRINKSQDKSDSYRNGTLSGIFHTQRQQVSLQNDVAFGDATLLTYGVDHTHEAIESLTSYAETERDIHGLFAELQQGFANQDVSLSLRSDDFGPLGRHTTGNLDWGYDMSQALRLTAGYGTAFKAPTFNDLYYPVQPWGEGNPDLEPESSHSYELGLRGKHANGGWTLNAFHTEIKDLIEWQCIANCGVDPVSDDIYKPFNVQRAEIDGLEGTVSLHRDNRDARVSLTLLDAKDAESGNKLQNRADATLRIDLDKLSGKWRNGLSVLAQGERYADSANSRKLDGYASVDLRSDYALGDGWHLKLKVRNLFDEAYQTTDTSYQPMGRSYLLSLNYGTGAGE